jgi:hypothetical protein
MQKISKYSAVDAFGSQISAGNKKSKEFVQAVNNFTWNCKKWGFLRRKLEN